MIGVAVTAAVHIEAVDVWLCCRTSLYAVVDC